MQKRNVLNSPRLLELKKHRRKAVLVKIFISFCSFLIFFVSLAYLSRLNKLNINDIEISGNKILDGEVLKTAAQEQIAGKYIWFFPKSNIFLYSQNAIKNALQNKFMRIKDINVEIKNQTLDITLTERTAEYLWCGDVPPDLKTANQKCYFLDKDGYFFDESPYFSGDVYFKFYGQFQRPTTDSPLGSYFLKNNFQNLIKFKNILNTIGLKPVSLYADPNGDGNIFLANGSSASPEPKLIFKLDADFQNVAENLEAALTTEPLRTQFKNNYSALQYIDLRFGNKVYDKFK